jgi:hypothetical protein
MGDMRWMHNRPGGLGVAPYAISGVSNVTRMSGKIGVSIIAELETEKLT